MTRCELCVKLVRALEDVLSSEPEMPSHDSTIEEADEVLVEAKKSLGMEDS